VQSFQKASVLPTADNKRSVEGLIHECKHTKTQENRVHLNISPTEAHEIVHDTLDYRKVTPFWVSEPPNATIRRIQVYGTSI
jgi:hypothetical protein